MRSLNGDMKVDMVLRATEREKITAVINVLLLWPGGCASADVSEVREVLAALGLTDYLSAARDRMRAEREAAE